MQPRNKKWQTNIHRNILHNSPKVNNPNAHQLLNEWRGIISSIPGKLLNGRVALIRATVCTDLESGTVQTEQTQSSPVVLFYPIDTRNRSVVCSCLEEEEVRRCLFLQESDQNTVKWICSDGSQLWKPWKSLDSPKYMPGKP